MIKKRIIIIDDDPMVLELVKEIIEEDEELETSHLVRTKNEFLNLVFQTSFDGALIDISVGNREGGIELLQILKSKNINLPSIILSAHDECSYALKCLQAGASGYVSKSYVCKDLIRGFKEVFSGKRFVSGNDGAYILKQYEGLNTFMDAKIINVHAT